MYQIELNWTAGLKSYQMNKVQVIAEHYFRVQAYIQISSISQAYNFEKIVCEHHGYCLLNSGAIIWRGYLYLKRLWS